MIVEALVAAAVSGLAPKALELFWNGRRSEAPPQPVIQIHTHFDSSDPYDDRARVPQPMYAPYTPLGTYDITPRLGLLEAGFFYTEEVELYASAPHLLAVFVTEIDTGYGECYQVWADRTLQLELPPGTYSLVALMFSPAADSLETAPIYAAGLTTDVAQGNAHINLDRHAIEDLIDERPFAVTGSDFYARTDFLLFSRAEAPDIPVMLSVA